MSREVTAIRGAVVGVLTAVVHLLVVVDVIPVRTESAITGLVDACGFLVALVLVRAGVTPLSDPRSADGAQLVPRPSERPGAQ